MSDSRKWSVMCSRSLFADGLGTCTRRAGPRPAPLESFGFTPYRQRCILQVLEELREALERDDGGGAWR